jgi:hypothetical protein
MGGNTWCVANPSAPEDTLRKGINYACSRGEGDADCGPLQPGGPCFQPNTVVAHASYAYNAYWQPPPSAPAKWHGLSCDFDGSAMLTHTDPSTATCKYPR